MSKICLIVDDVEVSQYVLSELMEELGFTVHSAATSKEALDLLNANKFDVIFLDWHLRKTSGLDFVPTIRAHRNGTDVPILVCTGVEMDKELKDIHAVGVQGLLKKPTLREPMVRELKRLNLI